MRILSQTRRTYEPGLKLYYRSPWVRGDYVSSASPIVIGGCDRSGTTLLRAAVDSHPQIAAGPESWLFVYKPDLKFLAEEYQFDLTWLKQLRRECESLGEFIDRFFLEYARAEGKELWCEKSPRNIRRLDYIWEHFPEARVIHIIRDGRDVVCSLRNHPRHRRVDGEYIPTNINRPIRECIDMWVRYVSAGLEHRGDPRYLELHYEELIEDYPAAMAKLCEHCRIDWTDRLLEREAIQSQRADSEIVNPEVRRPLYNSARGRWKDQLTENELRTVMDRGGNLLRHLGYLNQSNEPITPSGV